MANDMGVGPGTMDTAFVLFLVAWVAMMGAMMLPAVGPTAARDLALAPSATPLARVAAVLPFALGFLAPWAVYGALLFVALVGTGNLVDASPDAAAWLGVVILAIAGLYQLSPLKRKALQRCRGIHTPQAGTNALTRFRAGAVEGSVCVGCCWALMAVLIAFGVMNIAAMVGLAAVIFGEKVLRRPVPLARAAGVALLALAVVAAFHHPLLSGLTPMSTMMG
jgi:predicted metal-binding membrane protein